MISFNNLLHKLIFAIFNEKKNSQYQSNTFIGSVIIWDIRTTNKVMEFQETASPVTCITFHPSDFILAAGRNDGSVDLYDLETKSIISRADGNGHTVKCITFGLVFEFVNSKYVS